MKVLALSEVFPPAVGGSGAWMEQLYRRWPQGSVVVATDQRESLTDFPHPVEQVPLRFETWGSLTLPSAMRYAHAIGRVRKQVRAHHIDLIHANRCLPEGLIAKRIGLPYLCTVHGEELNAMGKSRELKWLARRVFAGAQELIATSHNTAQLLIRDWAVETSRLRVVQPGVDVARFYPGTACEIAATRQAMGWTGRRVILTASRLQRRKGQDMMIRALPAIRQSVGDEVLYAIVGHGEDKDYLQTLAHQADVRDHVQFMEPLPIQQLAPAYQAADLFVLSNRNVEGDFEGFGIVLVESQACGVPVVAGQSGGTRETLIENVTGQTVNCDEPTALAHVVSDLLMDDSRRMNMAVQAHQHAQQHFDWNTLAQTHRDALCPPSLTPRQAA